MCKILRQKRLNEVYEHLRKHFGIHTKTGFAEAVHYARNSMSAAFGGKEAYLTDKLFENICDAYPGVFNLHYLLTGEGELLTIEEEVKSEQMSEPPSSPPLDQSYTIYKTYEMLLKPIQQAHANEVAAMQKRLDDKDAEINRLNSLVYSLQQTIDRLNAASFADDLLKRHPFGIGVAENQDLPSIHNKV
jgi:hypothetical protein